MFLQFDNNDDKWEYFSLVQQHNRNNNEKIIVPTKMNIVLSSQIET